MTSAVKQTRTEREESRFSRAGRAIRRALSRICRGSSPPSPINGDIPLHPQPDYIGFHRRPQSDIGYEPRRPPLFYTDYEPRRPPQSDTDYEPRRPPQSDTDYEPRRPPLFYTDYEPRRPPQSDTDYEPCRPPQSVTDYEPRRPPQSVTDYEPRRFYKSDTDYEPRRSPQSNTYYVPNQGFYKSDTDYEPRRSRQSDTDYEPRRSRQSDTDYVPNQGFYKSDTYYEPRRSRQSDTDYQSLNGCFWSENHALSDASSEQPPRPSSLPSFLIREPRNRSPSFRKEKKHNKDYSASTSDSYMSYRYPPRTLTETGMIKSRSCAAGSREIEWYREGTSGELWFGCSDQGTRKHRGRNRSRPSPLSDPYLYLPSRKDTDDGGPSFNSSSSVNIPPYTQSIAPTVAGGRTTQESESEPGGDGDACRRSHSIPLLNQSTSANTSRGAGSLPNMPLETSFEEFTPDDDEHDGTYRFQCSGPGLYQCSVTGLVFHMEGEGVLVYRTVPWSRRFLVHYHKRPAGPLFDIKCVQQSVCRLHLPHCEIRSTGGGHFLSVAHVTDEDVEFISPHEITETHVIINITGFSTFGTVKDEDSPADPVRALVLLFYKPPVDPDPESLLNVLLLPRNVMLQDVLRFRKKLDADERYIETSPHCKLHPKQEYSLSTRPEDDSVLVQPTEAEFDCDNYGNYYPSFQVDWETVMKHIKLLLRDTNSSHVVWERRVFLSSTGGRRSGLNLSPPERLMDIQSSFIDGISGAVLKSLLDKLLEKKVIGDSERESADVMQNNRDKARCVIDTVRKKGEAACSEMIEFLREADPFLCEHLGLI
ncbi:uncharacterized protein LOC141759775 [Sebastes fasciatus]|uniref:uncharacterized protein LOC141759775 n=1 Tax=Sebastes fasciatus TaxID=394691 RepID=UPI003D9F3405